MRPPTRLDRDVRTGTCRLRTTTVTASPRSPDELLATCWTSAGDAASDRPDLRSPLSLRERIEAASSAGFRGFGLLSDDLPAAVAEYGLTGIKTMLADNGIVHLELEGIPYWWDDGAHRAGIRSDPAAACSTRRRHSAPGTSRSPPTGTTAPGTAGAGPRSSPSSPPRRRMSGPGWASSSFPGRTSRRCTTACSWSTDAGHDAGGVVIDVWHIDRGHTPIADLAAVPLDRIIGVELNDADEQVVGTLFEDTVHRRRYCGEGAFDLPAMITALRTAGWTGPWGVEILSD